MALVTPPSIVLPIPDHGTPSAAVLPALNRLDSHAPAASMTPVTPPQIAEPIAAQSTPDTAASLPTPNRPDRKLPAASSMLVTPFQIAVPISPHSMPFAASFPEVNKPDSHAPALSIRLHTPSWMDVPSAFQSMVCTAESPALNRLDSHSPAASSTLVTPFQIDVPSAAQSYPEITAAALSQLCVRPSPSNREPKNVPTASVTVESASPTVVNAPLMEPITPSTFSVASSPKVAVSPAEKASRSEAPFCSAVPKADTPSPMLDTIPCNVSLCV